MTDRFDRKSSSSDLLSRLKARKVLGVGECSGTTTASKVTQILGQKSEIIEDVELGPGIFCWNYFVAIAFLLFGIGTILFGDSYVKEMMNSLPGNGNLMANVTAELAQAIEYRIRTISLYLSVAVLCIGATMLYGLRLPRAGGLRTAQFASGLFSVFVLAVCLTEPDATACRTYMLLGLLLVNTVCSLYVTYPNWWVWSYVKRRLCHHTPYWMETSNHTTLAGSNLHPTCTASEESAEADGIGPSKPATSTCSTSAPHSSASPSEVPQKTHSD